jgi:hypothetical protein
VPPDITVAGELVIVGAQEALGVPDSVYSSIELALFVYMTWPVGSTSKRAA